MIKLWRRRAFKNELGNRIVKEGMKKLRREIKNKK